MDNFVRSARTACSALVLAAFPLAAASAQAPADSAARDSVRRARAQSMNTVVVTATRSATDARNVPQKVDVITRNDIDKTPALDVGQMLKKLSTIDIIEYPGLSTTVGIRGFRPSANYVQVLIDGRPSSTSNLSILPLDNVERIEVLKGPSSALYGSSAMGGTINVITRKSRGPLRVGGTVGYGSFGTTDLSGYAGGLLTSKLDFDLSGHAFTQHDDYHIGSGSFFNKLVGGTEARRQFPNGTTVAVVDPYDGQTRPNTSYDYTSGSARLGYALFGGLHLDVSGDGFRAYDISTPGDIARFDTSSARKDLSRGSVDATIAGTYGRNTPRLRVYANTYLSNSYSDNTTPVPFINLRGDTKGHGAQLQDMIRFGAQSITFGYDYISTKNLSQRYGKRDSLIAPYSPNSRIQSNALFVQGQWSLLDERLTGTLGGRWDHIGLDLYTTPFLNIVSGRKNYTAFNPTAGVQLRLVDAIRLHSTIGRAFVTPDPFNSAGQSITTPVANLVSVTAGNPALDPETSIGFDAGIGFAPSQSGFNADVTYFRTRVHDRVSTVKVTIPVASRPTLDNGNVVSVLQTYVNANSALMQGFEASASYDFGAIANHRYVMRLFTNATRMLSAYEYVRAPKADSTALANTPNFGVKDVPGVIVFGAQSKSRIRNVAPLTMTTGLEYDNLGNWNGRVTTHYVGRRLDSDLNVTGTVGILYQSYMIADLVVGRKLGESYRIDLSINNLTDEDYYEKRGYNLPGRNMQLRFTLAR